MDYLENLNGLEKFLNIKQDKTNIKHSINKSFAVLPFPTRNPERAKFENGFSGVVGEFSRIICDKRLVVKKNDNNVMKSRLDNVQGNKEDKEYLEKLIAKYFKDTNHSLLAIHSYVFKYYKLSEGKDSNGEVRIAHFLRDVFCKDNSLKYMFDKNECKDVISKLIIESFDKLEDNKLEPLYINQLSFIENQFYDDVNYLFKHEEYFSANFHILLSYYYFFYITQLSLKLNKVEKGDYSKVTEMFYLLDWEKSSKSRQSYKSGYIRIKDSNKRLLVHINTLEHLNQIFGVAGKNYVQLQNIFKLLEKSDQCELISVIKKWINKYSEIMSFQLPDLENKNYEELVNYLKKSLEKGIDPATISRYPLSIDAIGIKFFLKQRGSLGKLLNINQDVLLLITAICVKDKKKPLKKVFQEYERRGIFFDRYSKESIVELFDKLNMMEKISDSGDAQYVKPIL